LRVPIENRDAAILFFYDNNEIASGLRPSQ
jgi:hypothetical protein